MIEKLRVQITAEVVGEFSSPQLTFSADSFWCPSLPMLPHWHIKDPSHSFFPSLNTAKICPAFTKPRVPYCNTGLVKEDWLINQNQDLCAK